MNPDRTSQSDAALSKQRLALERDQMRLDETFIAKQRAHDQIPDSYPELRGEAFEVRARVFNDFFKQRGEKLADRKLEAYERLEEELTSLAERRQALEGEVAEVNSELAFRSLLAMS